MCRALVIEDDYFIATQIADLLAEIGIFVALAATQTDAIAAALEQKPAFILSDVRLAEGTGPDAVQAIVSALGSIPVIFITGSPEDCDPRIDAVAIFTKPFIPKMLVGAVQRLVAAY
jgi:CheY-like chemotaxis protein